MTPIVIHLGFPPTVNHYYSYTSRGVYISSKGRTYRGSVAQLVLEQLGAFEPVTIRLAVSVTLCAPDGRARDLDNYMKGLLDALTHAGVWADDSLIDQLHIYRGNRTKGGAVTVSVAQADSAMSCAP